MALDFLDRVMDAIERNVSLQGLTLRSSILKGESIALVLTPNGEKIGYQDGSYERSYSFALNAQSNREMTALNVLNDVVAYFDSLEEEDILSENGSFVVEGKEASSVPNLVSADDAGNFVYSATFKIKLYIERGNN